MSYSFRVDTCGSYLRSEELLIARLKQQKGEITKEKLTEIENNHIKALVDKQVAHGLKIVTDGELRRNDFISDFFVGWNGVERTQPLIEGPAGDRTGTEGRSFPSVVGKISANPNHPELGYFDYLKSVTPSGITPKILVPAPSLFCGSPLGFKNAPPPAPYTTYDELYADASKAFHDTLIQFYQHGCRYIQIDEPALLTGPPLFFKDDEKQQWEYFNYIKDVSWKTLEPALKDLPADLNILLHLCRGNNKAFTKQLNRPFPGYKDTVNFIKDVDPIASLLEYDDERSGSFEPLKQIHTLAPKQRILLGVVTTKTGKLESDEATEARIREAAKYVPLENLGICNQCGFATLKEGNYINEEEQWAKVDLLVRVGKKIWGSV